MRQRSYGLAALIVLLAAGVAFIAGKNAPDSAEALLVEIRTGVARVPAPRRIRTRAEMLEASAAAEATLTKCDRFLRRFPDPEGEVHEHTAHLLIRLLARQKTNPVERWRLLDSDAYLREIRTLLGRADRLGGADRPERRGLWRLLIDIESRSSRRK